MEQEAMPQPSIALSPALPTELLSYILTQHSPPTTVLICQSRSNFLSSLSKALSQSTPSSPPPPETEGSEAAPPQAGERHPLLIPTLHQIATSRKVHMVFVPTVTHLRAWLAVFPETDKIEGLQKQDGLRGGAKGPLLLVYGVLALHRDTSEWSAQGIGNSLAGVVEAGIRGGRRTVLVEERSGEHDDDVDVMDLGEEEDGRREKVIWEERVPMLNGNVRRAGLESEDGGWSGRTVEVGRIVGRWFKFRKGGWDSDAA